MQQLPLKVNIVPSLGIGMISIIMIHLPMAGAIMDRYERGKILQQTLPTEKWVRFLKISKIKLVDLHFELFNEMHNILTSNCWCILVFHIQKNITYQLNWQISWEKSMNDRTVITNSYLPNSINCPAGGIFSFHFPIKQTSSFDKVKQRNESFNDLATSINLSPLFNITRQSSCRVAVWETTLHTFLWPAIFFFNSPALNFRLRFARFSVLK